MASNFNQKEDLESQNTRSQEKVSGGGKFVWYALFIFIIPIFIHVGRRNWFRRTKEKAVEQLSNIDSKLTERFDVLENQLGIAKGALAHEKSIFTEIAAVRSLASRTNATPEQLMEKDTAIRNAVGRFSAVVENYPQLQSQPMMMELMKTVRKLEGDIEATRRFYSKVARDFNEKVNIYPWNVVASSMGLKRLPLFEAEDRKRENVKMQF